MKETEQSLLEILSDEQYQNLSKNKSISFMVKREMVELEDFLIKLEKTKLTEKEYFLVLKLINVYIRELKQDLIEITKQDYKNTYKKVVEHLALFENVLMSLNFIFQNKNIQPFNIMFIKNKIKDIKSIYDKKRINIIDHKTRKIYKKIMDKACKTQWNVELKEK